MTTTARHALVTGGARGIGAAVTHRLRTDGYHVTILNRDSSAAQALAAESPGCVDAVQADVADRSQVTAAFAAAQARFGPVEVLVNNAGYAKSAPFLKTDDSLWQRTMEVNLTGTMLCIREALPGMRSAAWGRIVNIASTAGLVGYAYVSAYCASKHAVVGLTRALARELARTGVTVNAVCPGYTDTDLVRNSIHRIVELTGRTEQSARAELVKVNPQGRLVDPAEVADAVAWLCGPGADAVTGQSIAVDGGEVM